MTTPKQIILLHPGVPEPLMDLLSEHLRRTETQTFLIAQAASQNGPFLELDILPNLDTGDASMVWRVQIPMHAVLAIAQFRPNEKPPVGFLSD